MTNKDNNKPGRNQAQGAAAAARRLSSAAGFHGHRKPRAVETRRAIEEGSS